MTRIKLWLARSRLRRIQRDIGHTEQQLQAGARHLDQLLTASRMARSDLFVLENPGLLGRKVSCVYGTPLRVKP